MITTLARMLGLSRDDAEASMHNERAARAVLTRRNLFAAAGAMAVGSAFSFGAPEAFACREWGEVWIGGVRMPGLAIVEYEWSTQAVERLVVTRMLGRG